jgi:hypothetical protein
MRPLGKIPINDSSFELDLRIARDDFRVLQQIEFNIKLDLSKLKNNS